MYLNKAFIIGNLTRDPELKSLPSGMPVVNFAVATSRVWKDKDGSKKEDTQFHNVVAFGPQAKTIAQYMKKGSSIMVEGRMQTRSWDSPEGKKYRMEIIVDSFQFGPRRDGAPASGGTTPATPGTEPVSAPSAPDLDTIQYPEDDINPDDIPF